MMKAPFKSHTILSFLLLISLVILFVQYQFTTSIIVEASSPKYEGAFIYEFDVNEDGDAHVKIIYKSSLPRGSSWLLVPKFIDWTNRTVRGNLLNWMINDSEYYFYKVLSFNFISESTGFEIIIEYDFPLAAIVVESESPHGIFYSPQIGFKSGNYFEAIIIFPGRFRARTNEAIALGSRGTYTADRNSDTNRILFKNIPSDENFLRIQIGFDLIYDKADIITLRNGIFEFITVTRYEKYAQKIIDFYNATYDTLINIFNVTLDHARVRFFISDFYTLMTIGGYIPFSEGEQLGDIYINMIFMRYVEGYLEVIALHELIHHFMWRAEISPGKLLWFHEGVAQFISIEIAESMGYDGATIIKKEIHENIKILDLSEKSNLGFLKEWTPYYAPEETGVLYTSSYYIISNLAEENGGLKYYAELFKLLRGKRLESNAILCYYLSLAANRSLFDKFNSWGFNLPDIYAYRSLIVDVEEAISSISLTNPFLYPFRKIAELLYSIALSDKSSLDNAYLSLEAALFIAKNARLIALITYLCTLFLIVFLLISRSNKREVRT
ncbi:MAG: hypothetical protein QXH24_07185 [Candidatus Bathyarchaeia archaeon]